MIAGNVWRAARNTPTAFHAKADNWRAQEELPRSGVAETAHATQAAQETVK